MRPHSTPAAFILGVLLAAGLAALGYLLADGMLRFKALDRTVTVKGLAEREVLADTAVWPIQFSETDNELGRLYVRLQRNNELVRAFLHETGFSDEEITVSAPAIFDRKAQAYGGTEGAEYRYAGTSTLTVYTRRVAQVRGAMQNLAELGKQGVAIAGEQHGGTRTEFLYAGLNDIKPAMIEEATRAARAVAEKFARDSESRLGTIRTARQGLFSIQDRDRNTPHIKRVRVVSTVEYYLID